MIPCQGREDVLDVIHENQTGKVGLMKSLARSYVWWPNMDKHLEEKVKSWVSCQSNQKNPPCSPSHHWKWPDRPLSQVHVDAGKTFLLIIDEHSKWMDIHCVNSTTTSATIEKLRTT